MYVINFHLSTAICRYGAKLIIDEEMTGGDLLIVR